MARKQSIEPITLAEVEFAAHKLAQELMTYNEPIPPFNTRYPEVLESCLKTPFQKFDRRALYRGLVGKASTLFYLMIKNHPFQNGNKRVAVMTLFYFLYKNGRWLTVDNDALYEFANKVAASPADRKDGEVRKIRTFIRRTLVSSMLPRK
jgi:death-on-curing family protein